MKSEERHELETNALAKLLEQGSDKIAPYASQIIYGLLAIGAIWALYRLSAGNMETRNVEEWNSYIEATLPGKTDEEAVKLSADRHAGKIVGDLSKMSWADTQLAEGCNQYFINKEKANELLDNALNSYKSLASSAKDKALQQRAQFGVARALEAKCEVEDAIKAYEKVTGPYSELAKRRAENLEELGAVEYATWLASAEGARPRATGGGSRPSFSPDALGLPGMGGLGGGDDFSKLFQEAQGLTPDAPEGGDSTEPDSSTEPGAEEPAAEDSGE